jgi:putative RNA 2'-phosphotransferase
LTSPDPIRVSKTMAFLLRHRPDVGGLTPDANGWVTLADLAAGIGRLLRAEVSTELVTQLVDEQKVRRFDIQDGRIRALSREEEQRRDDGRRVQPPDILYHATTDDQIDRIRSSGTLSAGADRHVFLSSDEAQAWRVAHRLPGGRPRVLYVDAARARRHGVRFFRNRRNGLYMATPVPIGDVLNLQEGFAEQISAGGVPISTAADGVKMALIRVTRRSGVTWEVAKGKLEPGEPPEIAAVREVREEMGVEVGLHITRYLGIVRYGFLAPGGLPRLKTVHLFLMEPEGPMESFLPAHREGIGAVRWFSLDDACRVVTHSSLVPMIKRAAQLLGRQTPADEVEAL